MRHVEARGGRGLTNRCILIALAGALLGVPQLRAQAPKAGNTAQGQKLGGAAKPAQPCCEITSINNATGGVTAKVNATGKTIQFKVKNENTLRSLKVGQTGSFGKPSGWSPTGPKMEILDPNSIDEGSQFYWNGVYMGVVVGVYPGSADAPMGPGPNPGGPAPGCTTCRNDAFNQLLACKNTANQRYQPGSPQWTSAMQGCQQTYNNAVTQCGCGGSGPAGGGGNACASCANSALQQLAACVRAANQQFQQHKSAAAAAQLQNDLEACNANYEKALNACPCH